MSGHERTLSALANLRSSTRSRGRFHPLIPLAVIVVLASFLVPTLLASTTSAMPELSSAGGIHSDACVCTFTLNESGLPNGTKWTGVYMGNHTNTNTTSVSWPTGNGTFNWTVLPTSFTIGGKAWPEWASDPGRGTVHVLASSVQVNVTFLRAWTITFTESGLPAGTNWTSRLLSYGQTPTTDRYSTNTFFRYPLYNGTYSFQILVASGGYGVEYVPTLADFGPIRMHGANISENVVFTTKYLLNTSASPTVGGSTTPLSGWFPAAAVVVIGEGPANGYTFSNWTGMGSGNYTGPNDSANVTMNGPINETAHFTGATFEVTFTETGLPSGTSWSVTLNGTPESSMTDMIVFLEVNSSYSFTVGAVSGFTANLTSGNLVVQGAPVELSISFTAVTPPSYSVTFTETGLASGTNWSVTLSGSVLSSTTSTIVFSEPNGNYAFTVGAVTGYSANPPSGTIPVNGAPATQTIVFSAPPTFALTFTESGLPSGTSWSVSVNGNVQSSTTTSIVFQLGNGSYTFIPTNVTGYTVFPEKGAVTIQGLGSTESVTYTATPSTGGSSSGGLSTLDWIIILVVILAIIGVLVALLSRRRPKETPAAPPEQNPPT
ncbi:MAG: hypothetical protein WAN87_01295 [Thermoplasmata archaeon]